MKSDFETNDILEYDIPVTVGDNVVRLLAPNPTIFTGKGTNTYLVIGQDSTVVIDPGPDDDVHIENILKIAPSTISSILVTHTHIDHWPGTPKLKKLTGAVTYGFEEKDGFAPDINLSDGSEIDAGGRAISVLYTPGHASNHLCYLLNDSNLLFTGDHIMNGATVIIPPPDGDMKAYLDSLRRLTEEKILINVIAPGHGHLINNPGEEIRRVIEHRMNREKKVIDALRVDVAKTIDEMIHDVYSDVSESLYPLAANSLFAHLRKLFDDSLVTGHSEGGQLTKDDPDAKWKLI